MKVKDYCKVCTLEAGAVKRVKVTLSPSKKSFELNQFYTSGVSYRILPGILVQKKIWKERTNKNEEGREKK
jgi:hypothetical protein